jgi:hypothetical protein
MMRHECTFINKNTWIIVQNKNKEWNAMMDEHMYNK